MKIYICIVLLAAVAVASCDKPHYDTKQAVPLFEKYMKDYNKHYKSTGQKVVHYTAFVLSLYRINRVNAQKDGPTLDLNKYSDYPPYELEEVIAAGINPDAPEHSNKKH